MYLIGFCFMECGSIACGLGFNGYTESGAPRHDRIRSCDLWGLATSYQVKDFLASWNISVHEWLKYYVYLRQLNSKSQSRVLAAFVSFMVSAVWHGFYPGFFHFFLGCFVLDFWNKLARPIVGNSALGKVVPGWLSHCFLTAFYYVWCSYFMISFTLLNFCDFNKVYKTMYYAGHVFLIVTLPILIKINSAQKRRAKAEKAKQQ